MAGGCSGDEVWRGHRSRAGGDIIPGLVEGLRQESAVPQVSTHLPPGTWPFSGQCVFLAHANHSP